MAPFSVQGGDSDQDLGTWSTLDSSCQLLFVCTQYFAGFAEFGSALHSTGPGRYEILGFIYFNSVSSQAC